MKNMKRSVALLVAIALLIGCAAGGTMAWLTMQTGTITNTFTVGDINITLDETMLMYGKEASNRKQEIDRQHYTIPNQRPKDKHCGKI